jgi:hypothetical protein
MFEASPKLHEDQYNLQFKHKFKGEHSTLWLLN